MRTRLPQPAPAVKAALRLLPHEPGVYILRDRAGRVVYVGRSRDLASRVRSYWTDLKDRPHLVRMLPRVAWLEPVLCESEHEAAFLESDLLERHPTRYNRSLGSESCVWLRLDGDPRHPALDVAHVVDPDDGAAWFGPYLGWEPVRQAAAGLRRLYPLHYAGLDMSRSDREMARSLGVAGSDARELARSIGSVLARDGRAVRAALEALERMRDRAASALMFEYAASLQEYIRGLRWISEPQKLAALKPVDHDYSAVGTHGGVAVRVVLALRGGRLSQRHVHCLDASCDGRRPEPPDAGADGPAWREMASRNAALMAALSAAGAMGPLAWKA